jgi:isopenicillin-N epimerase
MAAAGIASPAEMASLAELYLLRKDIAFLNHGSYGACPRPVFEVYQRWQRELEAQPVEFLGRRRYQLFAEARQALGDFVGAHADSVVFVPNVTVGMNAIARSLPFGAGDEILATDHEYGAVVRTWEYYCERKGGRFIPQPIAMPVTSTETFIEQLWAGVTERTKIITLSHITSATALRFPVEEVCRRAREAGILTVIDGAHAPGQVDLALDALGADFYVGNCHKWLSAPKGSGFLYARPEVQELIDPLVISWGWKGSAPNYPSHSLFIDHFEWGGTDDPAAFLSVPAAIEFQHEHNWPRVRAACRVLARDARERVAALTGLPQVAPDSTDWWVQMCLMPLPDTDPLWLKHHLWDDYQVEIPINSFQGRHYARISVQAYNDQSDVDRLVTALGQLLQLGG